jgi:hypothetical protein
MPTMQMDLLLEVHELCPIDLVSEPDCLMLVLANYL